MRGIIYKISFHLNIRYLCTLFRGCVEDRDAWHHSYHAGRVLTSDKTGPGNLLT